MVESIQELKKICRKHTQLYSVKDGSKGTPVPKFFYHRFIDSISIYFVKALLHTNITANQVTLFSIFVGIVAGILFSSPNPIYWLYASLALQFYFILDAVDGDIARYRKTANPIGKYYDIIAPAIVIPASLIGIAFGVFALKSNLIILLEGFIIVTFFLAAALSNATKGSLLYEFVVMKKNTITIQDITGPRKISPVKDGKITWSYTLKKLLSFQGLAMVIIVVTLLDLWLNQLSFTFAGYQIIFSYREIILHLVAIVTPIQFILRFYRTAKLKDKVMQFL